MYCRSQIMQSAWNKRNRHGMAMSTALRAAWMEARDKAPIHEVWGDACWLDEPVMLGHGLTGNQAREMEYNNKCRYDRLWYRAA